MVCGRPEKRRCRVVHTALIFHHEPGCRNMYPRDLDADLYDVFVMGREQILAVLLSVFHPPTPAPKFSITSLPTHSPLHFQPAMPQSRAAMLYETDPTTVPTHSKSPTTQSYPKSAKPRYPRGFAMHFPKRHCMRTQTLPLTLSTAAR